jgi:hypothetical protein
MFWRNPVSAPNNQGIEYPKWSRIDVYEQFIIVTSPDGVSHMHPQGFYSDVTFRKD